MTTMTTLNDIYDTLFDLGFCRDQRHFSTAWLGRSPGYFAYLRSSGARPSSSSLGMLAGQIFVVTPDGNESARFVERRRLRSAWVAAMTMWMGEAELIHAKPWERVTAIG